MHFPYYRPNNFNYLQANQLNMSSGIIPTSGMKRHKAGSNNDCPDSDLDMFLDESDTDGKN